MNGLRHGDTDEIYLSAMLEPREEIVRAMQLTAMPINNQCYGLVDFVPPPPPPADDGAPSPRRLTTDDGQAPQPDISHV